MYKRHSIEILPAGHIGEMSAQSDHDKRWLVHQEQSGAIDVDRTQERHSIEYLRAGYIGRDENTE